MRAEVRIIDDDGRYKTDIYVISPKIVLNNGVSTTYRYEFEYAELNDDIFEEYRRRGKE